MLETTHTQGKILIVDDDKANIRLLETILDQAGYAYVYSTMDAEQALPLFRSVQPDLILLDLAMPYRDGYAVMRELQSDPTMASVPILVLTADTALATRQRALQEGARDFLNKPLDGIEALLRIRNLLQVRFVEQQLVQQRLLTHRFINTLEEERRAISFELHDGLTQYVMSSFAFFESYAATLTPSKALLSSDLQKGLKYLQEAVVEARRMVNGLRSLALDEMGLVDALEQLLQEEQERACWEEAPLLIEDSIPRFDTALETAAYRIVQEALTNIRKHAGTKRLAVRLQMLTPSSGLSWRLQVEVRDWGRGFIVEEKQETAERVGLQSMEERVKLMNGSILIESQPGEGTRICAEFPIERRKA